MPSVRVRSLLPPLLTLAVCTSCGPIGVGIWAAVQTGDGSRSSSGAPGSTSQIGPSGGTVTGAGAQVVVPPGALSDSITLTISRTSDVADGDFVSVGPPVQLRPEGQTFSKPVTVRLPYEPARFAPGETVNDLVVLARNDATAEVQVLQPTRVDTASQMVEVRVTTLSSFQAAVRAGVDPARSTAFAQPTWAVADGTALIEVFVQVLNRAGRPIPNRQVQVTVTGSGNSIVQPGATDEEGRAKGSVVSTVPEKKTITVQVAPLAVVLDAQLEVTFATPPAPPPPPPAAPTNLTAQAPTSTRVDLAWVDASSTEQGFRVERAPQGSNAFASLAQTAPDVVAYSDATVSPGTAYDYRVIAVGAATDSAPSNVAQVQTPTGPRVTGVTPTSGPWSGGTTLTLTGSGFQEAGAGALSVEVGGVAAGSVNVLSDTQATAVTPAGTGSRTKAVTVRNTYGDSTLPNAFSYGGSALLFDADDFLSTGASFDLGTTSTFEFRLNLRSGSAGEIYNEGRNSGSEDKHIFITAGGELGVYLSGIGPNASLTSGPLALGTWLHVAVVTDATSSRLYLNGQQVAATNSITFRNNARLGGIGLHYRGSGGANTLPSFDGAIDEFRISSVARYTANFTPAVRLSADAQTLVLYHFDEGVGTSVADAGPAGRDGTLSGGPSARPSWIGETEAITEARLSAEVGAIEARPGQTAIPLNVTLTNRGTNAADLALAQVVFDRPGLSAVRTDAATSVPAGGSVVLTFEVAVASTVSPARATVDCFFQASDAANGGDASRPTARAPGHLLVLGSEELASSATAGGVSNSPTASSQPDLAPGPAGAPLVAWREGAAGSGEVRFSYWSGSAWLGLGASRTVGISNTATESADPCVRAPLTTPLTPSVTWREDTGSGSRIYLRRWSGAAWEELGGSAGGDGLSGALTSVAPALALSGNEPVVAWEADVSGNREVYLKQWSGAAWIELGGSATTGGLSASAGSSTAPELALTSGGLPVVAWLDDSGGTAQVYLKAWNGSAWVELGGSASSGGVSARPAAVSGLALALDGSDHPVVAWADAASGASQIYLRRWNGAAWVALAGSDSGSGVSGTAAVSTRPRLGLDPLGNPTLAWHEGTTQLYGARWFGGAWEALRGPTLAAGRALSGTTGSSSEPSLALDRSGRPLVAWTDLTVNPGAGEVYLRRIRGKALRLSEDFDTADFLNRFELNGNAVHDTNRLRLTQAINGQKGTAFFSKPLLLSSFRARFKLFAGGMADGISLAMLPGPALLGPFAGERLGVGGLDGGYAAAFGTWDGTRLGFATTTSTSLSYLVRVPFANFLNQAGWTTEVVLSNGRVQVYMENTALNYPRSLVVDTTVAGFGEFEGYLGVSGATGGFNGVHHIDDLVIEID